MTVFVVVINIDERKWRADTVRDEIESAIYEIVPGADYVIVRSEA